MALKKLLKTQIKAYAVISKSLHSPKNHRAATLQYKANYFYIATSRQPKFFFKKK